LLVKFGIQDASCHAPSEYRDNIQTIQLAGQWYATMTGLGDNVPKQMRVPAMRKVFNLNVKKFGNREFGAADGMGADGQLITNTEQTQEIWVGATFAVAATRLQEGLKDEAYKTAWGIYDVSYKKRGTGSGHRNPGTSRGGIAAPMCMRPAAIWVMEMTQPPTKDKTNPKSPAGHAAGQLQ
jgi:non-lysosomal glucosylceramidase